MDTVTAAAEAASHGSAFEFHGRWQEFLPIALSNLLLTIVTLGVYRFWAKTRERKYLWSRTRFIDERLEWAGTGKEMFVGFLVVMAVLLPIVLFLQFGVQALLLRGYSGLAAILGLGAYVALLYFAGVALFRALRYRLSRTYWHGIRGGSDDPSWSYGGQAIGRYGIGIVAFGLLIPWAMVTLWRKRWGAMSFGPHPFQVGDGSAVDGLIGRYLLIYVAPFAVLFVASVAGMGTLATQPGQSAATAPLLILAAMLGFYAVFLLLSLAYYAAFLRKVIAEMRLSTLEFDFTARTLDWLKLMLGNIALVVATLGVGLIFISYRNWSFFIRHLEATGEISVSRLTQSTTSLRSDAEGLADAFDIGAI
jgi:uncharacterized membrane protein YjgN (DUF898 family)